MSDIDKSAEISLEENDEDSIDGKYLTFQIGKEEYGVEIRYVIEIIGIQKITDLPDTPHYIKGVINLRGKVIPVIDIRLRFGLSEKEYDERTCIIVLNMEHFSVGLIVDSVAEVLDIPDSEVSPAPKVNNSSGSRYVKNLGKVGKEVKILLDVHKLLFVEEMESLSQRLQEQE